MTDRKKAFVPVLVVCGLLLALAGCGRSKDKIVTLAPPRDIATNPAEEKKAALLKQLEIKFENPQAHFELGQLYQAEGLWSKAEYHYNVALSFDPANRNSQAAMVKLMFASGNAERAKILADTYINQVCANAAESLQLGLAFQNQQLEDYAIRCFQQALRLAPNSAVINKQIGYYYLSKNDKAHAQEYLIRSFQLDSNQPELAGELGRLGIAVKIPAKSETDTKKLDKIVEQAGTEKNK